MGTALCSPDDLERARVRVLHLRERRPQCHRWLGRGEDWATPPPAAPSTGFDILASRRSRHRRGIKDNAPASSSANASAALRTARRINIATIRRRHHQPRQGRQQHLGDHARDPQNTPAVMATCRASTATRSRTAGGVFVESQECLRSTGPSTKSWRWPPTPRQEGLRSRGDDARPAARASCRRPQNPGVLRSPTATSPPSPVAPGSGVDLYIGMGGSRAVRRGGLSLNDDMRSWLTRETA